MAANATYGLTGLTDAFPPGMNPTGDLHQAPMTPLDLPQFGGMQAMSAPAPAQPAPSTGPSLLPATPFDGLFAQAESQYGLPPGMLKAMANVESRFNPNATSPAGARGIMQFMPATAARFGIQGRETDPAASIDAAGRYMQTHMNMFGGDIVKAIAAYNAGEGNVQKAGGIPNFPETQAYVPKVLAGFDNPLRGGGPSVVARSPVPAEGGFVARAGDVGISAVKGAIGVPEFVVGLADMVTGGQVGQALEQLGFRPAEAKAFLDSYYSDAQKSANKNVDDAQGFIATAAAAVSNPSTIAHAIIEALPAMGGGGVVARGLVGAAKVAPWAAGAIGEGVVGGGMAAEQVRQQSPDGLLSPTQMGASAASGLGTAAFGALGGKMSQKLGVLDVDTMLAGGMGTAAKQGFFKRLALGGITEGAFEELPQSAQEQLWQNVALNKPLMEGVPEAAAMGLVVGGTMGAVGGGLTRAPQQRVPAAEMDPAAPADTDAQYVAQASEQAKVAARARVVAQGATAYDRDQQQRIGAADSTIGSMDFDPITGQLYTTPPGQQFDLLNRQGQPGFGDPVQMGLFGDAAVNDMTTQPPDAASPAPGQMDLFAPQQGELNFNPVPVNPGAKMSMQELIARNAGIKARTKPDIKGITGAFESPVGTTTDANQWEVPLPAADDAQIRAGIPSDRSATPVPETPPWQAAVKSAFTQAKSKATKTLSGITAMETPDAAAAVIRDKYSATGDRAPMKNTMVALNAAHTALTGVDVETYDKQQAASAVPPAAQAPTQENSNGTTTRIQTLPQEGRNAEGQANQGPREERVGQGKEGGVRQTQEKGKVLTAEQRKNNPLALLAPEARAKAMMVIGDVLGWDEEGRPDGRKPISQAAAATKRGVSRAAINKVFAKLNLDKNKIARLLASGASADMVDLSELMPSQGESVRETGDETSSGTGFSEIKNPNEYHVNETASAGMTDEERRIAQKNRADTKAADEWAAAQGAVLPSIKDTAEPEVQTAAEQSRADEVTSKVRNEAAAGAIAEWAKVLQGKEAVAAAADWDAMSNLPEGDIAPAFELLPINDAAEWVSVYTDLVAHEADWAEFEAAHQQAIKELPDGNRDIPSVKELADYAGSREVGNAKQVAVTVRKTRSRSESPAGDHRPAQGSVDSERFEIALRAAAKEKESTGDVLMSNGRFVSFSDAVRITREAIESGAMRPWPAQMNLFLGTAMRDADRVLAAAKGDTLNSERQDGVGAVDAVETQRAIGDAKTVGSALESLRPTVDRAWHPLIDKLLAHPSVAASSLELTHADAIAEESGRPVLGQYFADENHTTLHNGAGLMTLLHEATHARTHAALRGDMKFRQSVKQLYDSAKKQTKAAGGNDAAYGFQNLDEFVAEIYGNTKFSDAMNGLMVGGESILTRFKNLIRKLLGLPGKQQSIVDAVVAAVDEADAYRTMETPGAMAGSSLAQEVALDTFADTPLLPGRTRFMDTIHDFALDLIGDKGKAWGMNFMTMRDLKDTFGKRLPSLAAYVDTMLTMGADSHATALEYAKVQEEMLSLKSKDTQGKLLDLMTDSTQAGIHPDRALDDKSNKHVTDKAAWTRLHAQWNALGASPDGKKAQAAYVAARELFRKNWEKRLELLEEKVKSVGMDEKELAKWKASTAAWAKKPQGPYFPLTRFGDWVSVWKSQELVDAEDAQEGKKVAELKQIGKHYKVAFMDSMTASKRLAAQWGDAGGKSYSQKRVEFATSSSTVDKVFLDKIESQLTLTLGTGKEGKAAVAAMKELYAYTMPDLSIMKRTLARRGVDGVDSREMLRAFSRAGMADAFYMARLKYADKAVDHLQELRKEDSPDKSGDHSVLAHMIKLHRASMQKVDTPIQSVLANASYITMLGASPAFLTINAMQPWMISLPVMGGRHGTMKTAKALQSAYPDAMGLFKALWSEQGWRFSIDMESAAAKKAFAGKDGERLMLKHLLERGIIDIGIENDLRAVSEGQEAGTNKYVKAFTAPAQYVETINRVTTALAAYRLEMGETNNDDTKARAYAEKMTADTQLDYSAANAPYVMRPGVVPGGRLLFQFRKYQQGMLALLIKQLGAAVKGEDEKARKEARNALYGLLATHMTMTGLAGLPVAFPLGVLAAMIAQAWDDDDEPQPDIWWSNFLADYFGTTTAKVINGGLPTLLGVDMQRMGLGNITAPMPYVSAKGTLKDTYKEAMLNLAPAEGLLTNWFAGIDSFAKGDWAKGLTQVMPKAFADPIRAMKLADDGLRTARGNPVFSADDITGGELAMKAAGFQPTKISTYYKAKSATEDYRLKALSVRDDLVNRWVESKGDLEKRAAVMEDIQGYRERHKGQKGVDLTYAQLHKAGVADAKFARNTTTAGITANRGEQWKRDMTRFAE